MPLDPYLTSRFGAFKDAIALAAFTDPELMQTAFAALADDRSTYLARGVIHGHLNMTPNLGETRNTLNEITRYLLSVKSG